MQEIPVWLCELCLRSDCECPPEAEEIKIRLKFDRQMEVFPKNTTVFCQKRQYHLNDSQLYDLWKKGFPITKVETALEKSIRESQGIAEIVCQRC